MTAENPTILRMRLGAELRALREGVPMSLTAASRSLADNDQDISASKLNRLENGKGAVKLQDIKALLDLYRLPDGTQREMLLTMAREAKGAARAGAWWTDYESVLPSGFEAYVGLESHAVRLSAFTLALIDGLLQTEEYARAVIRAWCPSDPDDRIDRLTKLRLQRQQLLTRAEPLELVTIMDETALLRPVGGARAQRQQLLHLAETADSLPNVTVQVVPLSASPYSALGGHFTIIDPPDAADRPVVYIDGSGGNLYLQGAEQIRRFRTLFGHLQAIALSPTDSVRRIRQVAEEL